MFTLDFVCRYAILLTTCIILLRAIYFRLSPDRDSVFSFFLFANGVFLVTYLLHNIDLSMGFAFGLFAVFAMLRYRTEPITIRDMTYLFVVIGASLMCALASMSYLEIAGIMALVCTLSALGETRLLAPRMVQKKITYDSVELIDGDNTEALIAELSRRTGFDIVKVDIGKIDYLNDSAQLTVFCRENKKR